METTTLNLQQERETLGRIQRLRAGFQQFDELVKKQKLRDQANALLRVARKAFNDAAREVAMHETTVHRNRQRLELLQKKQQENLDFEAANGGIDKEMRAADELDSERQKVEKEMEEMEKKYQQGWTDYEEYCRALQRLEDKEFQEAKEQRRLELFVSIQILNHHHRNFLIFINAVYIITQRGTTQTTRRGQKEKGGRET